MTVIDQITILDDKIKSNQAQYDLGREAPKISALSSEDLLEKYEYLTGEDLWQRPRTLEKTFEYSPLGAALANNAKRKANTKTTKDKTSIWYIIYSIILQSLRISMNLKNYHLALYTKN